MENSNNTPDHLSGTEKQIQDVSRQISWILDKEKRDHCTQMRINMHILALLKKQIPIYTVEISHLIDYPTETIYNLIQDTFKEDMKKEEGIKNILLRKGFIVFFFKQLKKQTRFTESEIYDSEHQRMEYQKLFD